MRLGYTKRLKRRLSMTINIVVRGFVTDTEKPDGIRMLFEDSLSLDEKALEELLPGMVAPVAVDLTALREETL